MNPTLDAFLRSWPFDPWLLVGLGVTGWIYLRGSTPRGEVLRTPRVRLAASGSRTPDPRVRLAASWSRAPDPRGSEYLTQRRGFFLAGLATIYLALASPLEPFAPLLLQVHMLQHLLLMMAAPPLIWLGAPLIPLLRGLPLPVRTYWIAPLFRSSMLRRFFGRLTHPALALPIFVVTTWLWHAPAAYELALRSSGWHYLQHVCFLAAGLLFWYPVVRPYPSRPRWSSWLLLPYLILADLQNTVLSALLTFSGRVLYPHYLDMPRLGRLTALEDQSAAGVLMWVPGSIAFLVPLFVIGFRLLYGRREDDKLTGRQGDKVTAPRTALPLVTLSPCHPVTLSPRHPVTPSPFDLLRVPLLGRFLKWRHARLALQLPLAALAGIVILDGLCGPQVGAMNLAGVLPWIHWRGLLILTLLAAGNFFCLACPFTLPRTMARRWLPAGRGWPRRLRNKWLAVVLLVLFLWAYEAFSLWDSPWWTAWLALGYFAGAFVVDGFFRGAAFCKYLCPIGQYNFVQSLVSPLEVKVRDPDICAACRTKDCIRGRDGIPGCELHLYQPRKKGNMDCTFCLDCVHACPHDNIGMQTSGEGPGTRGAKATEEKRPDLAVLIIVLVFGAFTNAAGMVGPVLTWRDELGSLLGQTSPLLVTTLFYILGLVVLPALTVGCAAVWSRRWGKLNSRWFDVAMRYAYALVPLGFSMWLAHYSFHLLTSYDAAIPTMQRFAADHGWTALGTPQWVSSCCRPVADWLPRLDIVCLDVGLLLSLYTAYRIALAQAPSLPRALRALAPWAMLIAVLFAAGVWLVFQPMEMRGTIS